MSDSEMSEYGTSSSDETSSDESEDILDEAERRVKLMEIREGLMNIEGNIGDEIGRFVNNVEVKKCSHTENRKCSLIFPCCGKVYKCWICHDEENNEHDVHLMDIVEIICDECNTKQRITNKCVHCGIQFAKYYCDKCHYFTNEKMFHCPKCERCTDEKMYIHCDKCGYCMPKNHICIENAFDDSCSICLDKLKNGKFIRILNCGHIFHNICFINLIKTGIYSCPVCRTPINGNDGLHIV
jgi:hypothetical protein